MAMNAMLEADRLFKSYGSIAVLKNVSFRLEQGETFAVIGPNGAGKTTLFKTLTGEVFADRGSIKFCGQSVERRAQFLRVRSGFGRTFQVARVFPDLSALENVTVAIEARIRTVGKGLGSWLQVFPRSEIIDEAQKTLASIGLDSLADIEARYLSHGDKKRLDLAIALSLEPRILMLDEPTAGMSASERGRTVDLLQRLRGERNITIMLTEHDMDVVFGLATTVMVLNYGEIVAVGTPESVRRDPNVREIYLGEETDA